MSYRLTAAVLMSLVASVSYADSLPQGLTYDSESRLEYLSGNGSHSTSFLGKSNLGYRFPSNGSLTFGVDLGADNWYLNNEGGSGTQTAYHLEAVIEGRFGSLALGQTRGAAQMMIDLPPIAGSGTLENSFATATEPGLRHELLRGGFNPGLRYQFDMSGTLVTASVNRIDGYGNVAQLTASAPVGAITVQGAIEFHQPSSSTSVLLGAKGTFGAVDAGIYHFTDGFYNTGGSTRAYAIYHLSERVEAGLTVMTIGDVTLGGLDAKYTTARGIFGQAGIISSSDAPNPVFNIAAGMSF